MADRYNMANINISQILMKRGNTAAASNYVGPLGELLVDTGLQTIRIQDGATPGGWVVSGGGADLSTVNANIATLFSNAGTQQTQITNLTNSITGANIAIVTANTSMKSYTDGAISWAINNLINSAPGTLDTLGEIAANLAADAGAIGGIITSITSTNSNVATLQANVGEFYTWANVNFGTSSYSNANVAAYLANYDGELNFVASPAIISGVGSLTTLTANVTDTLTVGTIVAPYGTIGTLFGPGISMSANVDAGQEFTVMSTGNATNSGQTLIFTEQNQIGFEITDTNSNNNYSWAFNSDGRTVLPGNLVFADSSIQTTAWTGATRWDATPAEAGCPIYAELTPDHFRAYTQQSHLAVNNDGSWDIGSNYAGTGVYSNDSNATLYSNSGNVTIRTNYAQNYWTFGSDGTTQFPNDTIKATTALSIATPETGGIPASVANWNSGGGWNQGTYSNLATTSGTGSGLTVDITGAFGYITIDNIAIHTPGTGYTDGDVITIVNENSGTGTFTITTRKNIWQFGTDGNLIFPNSTAQTTAWTGSVSTLVNGSHTVSLGTDGTLTAPGNVYVTGNLIIQGNTYQEDRELFVSSAGEAVEFANGGNIFAPAGLGNIVVSTNTSQYNWTFGSDGELYLPTGGRIGFAGKGWTGLDGGNGAPTSLTSYYASGMYSSCVTANPSGVLNISTYGDGTGLTNTWNFNADGINFLDNSVQATAWTGAVANIGNVAPTTVTAVSGAAWYNTDDGRLYIKDGSYWVDANPTVAPAPSFYLGNLSVDGDVVNFTNGNLTIDNTGNLLVNGSLVTGTGSSYGNVNVAQYLNNLNTTITWTDGTNILVDSGLYLTNGSAVVINSGEAAWTFGNDSTLHWPNSLTVSTSGANAVWTTPNATTIAANNGITLSTQSGDYNWVFGTDGNLTLPGNASAINYANGQSILNGITGSGSSANTGNITFSGSDITGTGSNVTVTADTTNWVFNSDGNLTLPNGSTIGEIASPIGFGQAMVLTPFGGGTPTQQLRIYPTQAEGDHIHLTSGDLSQTSIFLGDDSQYVRTNNGDIVIGTNDSVPDQAGSGHRWTFANNGSTTFPDQMPVNITGNLTVGNLVVNGNSAIINTVSYSVEDNIIQIADNNPANTLDIGFVGHRTVNGQLEHTGLVRNASADRWELFSNVVPQPGATVDFTNAIYDNLQLGQLKADTIHLTGTAPTGPTGNPGDLAGDIHVDDNFIYRCFANYADQHYTAVGGTQYVNSTYYIAKGSYPQPQVGWLFTSVRYGSDQVITGVVDGGALGWGIQVSGVIQNNGTVEQDNNIQFFNPVYPTIWETIPFTAFGTPLYTDSNVAAYLSAHVPTGTYSNANVASYLTTQTFYSNANVAGYLTTQTFYSNANVASYLVANPQAGTYSNANVASYLVANPQAGTYSNTNVSSYLSGGVTTGNLTASGNVVQQSAYYERYGNVSNTGGNLTCNFNNGTVFYANLSANVTANFTNVNAIASTVTGATVIVDQGATAYRVANVQVNGVNQTVKWVGATAGAGTASNTDVMSFSLINLGGGAYRVLGQISNYG